MNNISNVRKSILICVIFLSFYSFGQLKVDPNGRVGIGFLFPNPEFKCHIGGNLLLSNYPSTPHNELRMKLNYQNGIDIGANTDNLHFWADYVGYNKAYGQAFYTTSDKRIKSDIVPIHNGLEKILSLNSYQYKIIDNGLDSLGNKVEKHESKYGFISQEVDRLFPEVDITAEGRDGLMLMEYNQIIPLLVSAVKEQQLVIDSLNELVLQLIKAEDRSDDHYFQNQNSSDSGPDRTMLFQNEPNPFSQSTKIRFEIIENDFRSASILVFDMNGKLERSYNVQEDDKELIIQGSDFEAGMYLYSLLINDQEVDTKRMILR